jgi:hypothetical protein
MNLGQETNPRNSGRHIFVFWHIFAPPGREIRLQDILTRQFALLKESGLLDACSGLFVGLVGTSVTSALNEILAHPKTKIVNRAASGNEEVTTARLKEFADEAKVPCKLLYMHARGITKDPHSREGLASDDWTKMLEFFNLARWKNAVDVLNDHYTAGCEMWSHAHRTRPGGFSFHYAGNFWWARSDYVKRLDSPMLHVPSRSLVGEDWILQLAGKEISLRKFYVLHRTTKHKYTRGMVHSYQDRYPPKYYSSGSEIPDIPLDPNVFHGEKE